MFVALRAGLEIRRRRLRGQPPQAALRSRHLRFARPAVVLVVVGFVAGPVSAVLLRGWEVFGTLHAAIGGVAALSFVAAAVLGHRLEGGERKAREAHARVAALAALVAALAAVAGFVLLP